MKTEPRTSLQRLLVVIAVVVTEFLVQTAMVLTEFVSEETYVRYRVC